MIDIQKVIEKLQNKRKCFVSEADFQLEFAWIIKKLYPEVKVRCEYSYKLNDKLIHIDVVVIQDNVYYPIELKYKTKKLDIAIDNEKIYLTNQAAVDQGCYKFLVDIKRLENLKEEQEFKYGKGYAIILTNDMNYTRKPRDGSYYESFSLEEGKTIEGELDWIKGTSEGTKNGCEDSIKLNNKYECRWNFYSSVSNNINGTFKYMIIEV